MKEAIKSAYRSVILPEVRRALLDIGKVVSNRDYCRSRWAINRLSNAPRRISGTTNLLGPALEYVDALSTGYTFKCIFDHHIYDFHADDEKNCVILDCGANIGLSVIYFKRRHPWATVIAFEADEQIYAVLERNVRRFGLTGVELRNEAVWVDNNGVSFEPEGADGGRIECGRDTGVRVKSMRLRSMLDRDIDLLKLDIEGAETQVLRDCKDVLGRVKRIFVEYHSYAGQPQTMSEILTILTDAGFRYYIHPEGDEQTSLFTAQRPRSGQDMTVNICALRE